MHFCRVTLVDHKRDASTLVSGPSAYQKACVLAFKGPISC